MDLTKALKDVGWNGKLLAHVMPWVNEPNHIHRCSKYTSNDPKAIKAQLDNMQAVNIRGVILTWRGIDANVGWDQNVASLIAAACGNRGMLFAYLLDPNLLKYRKDQTLTPTQEVIRQLKSPGVQAVLHSKSYVPEGYVLDFLTGYSVDWAAVEAAVPGIHHLMRHQGYEWPSLAGVAGVNSNHKNPLMKIPGIAYGFNDAGCPLPYGVKNPNLLTGRDYSQCVWSTAPNTQPARVNDPGAGHYFLDVVAGIGASTPARTAPYAAFVTWNDYDEGTATEAYISAMTGIRI